MLRVFDDPETGKRWQRSVRDQQLEILCVSQFTLYHRVKGNRLDFHLAMQGEQAHELYKTFISRLQNAYEASKVKGN